MTKSEVPAFLDSLLMPFKKEDICIQANNTLSASETDLLCQIVCDFERQDEQYDVKKALADISGIMGRYVSKADTQTKGTSGVIPIKPSPLPFMIKQVLFYIAVMCKACEIKGFDTQAGIIDEIKSNGANISHNFFSKMDKTPEIYLQMANYIQPELPTNYKGQKHGELGFALKNLSYQCGKYSKYIDIFGGSGAASLAVEKRKNTGYVYNELHRCVCNLYDVLCDDVLYKQLIDELKALQDDLKGIREWDTGVDFDIEMSSYYNSKNTHDIKEDDIFIMDNNSEFILEYDDVIRYMNYNRNSLMLASDDWTYSFDGKDYNKDELLKDIFPSDASAMFMSYCNNYRLILGVADCFYNNVIRGIYKDYEEFTHLGKNEKANMTLSEYDTRQLRLRFYMYYAYFENLLNKPGVIKDKVRYAVAQIFRESLITNGQAGISSVLRIIYNGSWYPPQAASDEAELFLETDFEPIITKVHNRASGTIIENDDCINIIKKYQQPRGSNMPLFYSDSPYEGTSDYVDEINGITAFTAQSMKDLIIALRDSGNNFIFSCRAAKGSVRGSKITKNLQKINAEIYNNVFQVFKDEIVNKGMDLWVLAIEKGDTLADLIKKNKISEIMVTNFEICSFTDKNYKNVNFKAYSFADFLDILDKNINK